MTNKKWNQEAVMKLLQNRKEEENKSYTDQRQWNPTAPKKDKAVYRVRVLPNMLAGGLPWVYIPRHGFKAPSGNWVIENCPSAIYGNKKGVCPIDDYAGPFFNTGDPKDKNFASNIYRKKTWVVNILVIKDPRDGGANEGKVFLWKFGKKIYDKLEQALMPPKDSGLEQIMFIDPYKGYDLNIVAKMVHDGDKEFPNYDESVFVRDSTPIAKDEDAIDKVLASCYDLEGEFLAPKQFKSYDELQKILDVNVINYRKGGDTSTKTSSTKTSKKEEAVGAEDETVEEQPSQKQEKKTSSTTSTTSKKAEPVEETDDDEFLKNLEKELNGGK